MTSETTEPKTPVQRIVSPLFREGDTVTVLCHDEGYVGQTGTILRVIYCEVAGRGIKRADSPLNLGCVGCGSMYPQGKARLFFHGDV
jgi:hypothetical protein